MMKPIVFDPLDRPNIRVTSTNPQGPKGTLLVDLVEIHHDYMITCSRFSLALRGQLKFQNQLINFINGITIIIFHRESSNGCSHRLQYI